MSVEMEIDVYGIPELRRKLDRLDESMRQSVDESLNRDLEAMRTTAENLAPKRTGRLARSIIVRRVGEWAFQLLALAPYAKYVEFGTRYMVARRFLRNALELTMPGLVNHLNNAISRAIWEASTS